LRLGPGGKQLAELESELDAEVEADGKVGGRVEGHEQVGDLAEAAHKVVLFVGVAQLHHGHAAVGKDAEDEGAEDGDEHERDARVGLGALAALAAQAVLVDDAEDAQVEVDEERDREQGAHDAANHVVVGLSHKARSNYNWALDYLLARFNYLLGIEDFEFVIVYFKLFCL